MAILRNVTTDEKRAVEPDHLFGRASHASVHLSASFASAQHAAVRWSGRRWVVRDLGSRNGTYLDGTRLSAGEERPIQRGSILAFGKPGAEAWEMMDDEPPTAMVVPVGGGAAILAVRELLAVPSSDDPEVTIYRGNQASWLLERADEATTPITNTQTFMASGCTWRFCCPDDLCETSLATIQHDQLEVRHLQLVFSVSRDEEHVSLRVSCGARTFDVGARGHNYLLLTLARRRIEDAAAGLTETSCGWVYADDMCQGLDVMPGQLNLDVYRLRRQFAEFGIVDAGALIERRPRTRQLRIGTPHLSVVRL